MKARKSFAYFSSAVVGFWLLAVIFVGAAHIAGGKPLVYKQPVSQKPLARTCQPDTSQLLTLINQERLRLGAPALSIDASLVKSAHNKLTDEVNGAYYGHNLLDGSSTVKFIREQGVNTAWGEDIDADALTPQADWIAFKNSPEHYASLTNPQFTRAGVAEQCTNFVLEASTGPDDNSAYIGQTISELTVVHLASD